MGFASLLPLDTTPSERQSTYHTSGPMHQGIKRKASNALIACGQRRGGWYRGQCQAWDDCFSWSKP
jgi:hypothetical protein